jgi:ArsR family transcriptional regulator
MAIDPNAVFAALANPTRLRCLLLLEGQGELCVCELTHALGTPQPNVSRHLAQLREANLVLDRREGLWIHYRIHPEVPAWVAGVIGEAARGLRDTEPFASDRASLVQLATRAGVDRCA